MEAKDRVGRSREKPRARESEATIGPVGNLFASPAVARVLVAFLQDPDARLTLSQIKERAGRRAKGTVQSGLRTLLAARLVYREGRGNRTFYRYASDRELGRRMRDLIEASRREVTTGASTDIPWLEGLMRATPGAPVARTFGGRMEETPNPEATERVLMAGELVDGARQSRSRPGLRTRA